jgi:hypothetical protein
MGEKAPPQGVAGQATLRNEGGLAGEANCRSKPQSTRTYNLL